MFTPHFTSAIAAFGIVFSTYSVIVLSEIWFVYRKYFVDQMQVLEGTKSTALKMKRMVYAVLSLGAFDLSDEAVAKDKKAVKILAAIGIPVACFLHGYAGFIFGSVKANALWMSPLMPVIFIMSAVVSGIALCMLTYIIIMEWKKFTTTMARGRGDESVTVIAGVELDVIKKTTRYLLGFLVAAITLELLDIIFRGYTAMKSWDILREVMYKEDFFKIFVMQYGIGNLLPFILLMIPGAKIKRTAIALALILFGVFMMRWNVVVGGQAFSLSFAGFMHYNVPVIPTHLEEFKEGLLGALTVAATPFILFYIINKFIPSLKQS